MWPPFLPFLPVFPLSSFGSGLGSCFGWSFSAMFSTMRMVKLGVRQQWRLTAGHLRPPSEVDSPSSLALRGVIVDTIPGVCQAAERAGMLWQQLRCQILLV